MGGGPREGGPLEATPGPSSICVFCCFCWSMIDSRSVSIIIYNRIPVSFIVERKARLRLLTYNLEFHVIRCGIPYNIAT